MLVNLTAADLADFEADIADCFKSKQIKAPVHLQGGSEEYLIEVFKTFVDPEDWICTSWRSHLHCLLRGVPPIKVKEAILAGKSIALCFPEYRIISSAIVGGMAPVAVGLGMGIKRKNERRKVICFIGDMTSETGIVHESRKYAAGHDLPVLWIIEDNGYSVCSPTDTVWGIQSLPKLDAVLLSYKNKYPHCGVGEFVRF